MDDMISRRAVIDAVCMLLDDWFFNTDWRKHLNVVAAIEQIPSVQPEHLVKESGNLVNGIVNDCISRQQAILAIERNAYRREDINETEHIIKWVLDIIKWLPSVQPERMTNRQWVDFLSAQFDISRTSAKEMLHGMMRWKKEDNFKKMFNGGKT